MGTEGTLPELHEAGSFRQKMQGQYCSTAHLWTMHLGQISHAVFDVTISKQANKLQPQHSQQVVELRYKST